MAQVFIACLAIIIVAIESQTLASRLDDCAAGSLDHTFADVRALFISRLAVVYCEKNHKNQSLDCNKGGAGYERSSMLFRISAVYNKLGPNMNESLVRYELWDEGDGLSFFPEGDESYLRVLAPSAKLIWSCVAASWNEAQSKKHEFLGWEPYVPL